MVYGCEDDFVWAFAFRAVGCLQGFDTWVETCAFRGKECGVQGVRDGSELREDRRR